MSLNPIAADDSGLPGTTQPPAETPIWSLAKRIAFRACFVYFFLYILLTQIITAMLPIPGVDFPDPQSLWGIRHIILWLAKHLFRITTEPVYQGSGSGDKIFDYILLFCMLVITAFATPVWSYLDRRRPNYIWLYKWFRLFVRFALAGQMFSYGLVKAIPLQMSFPGLIRLLEPYGNLSPMGILWASIGASTSYEIFAGCCETLAGILLVFPRLTSLGAMFAISVMGEVFMLNMTFDVPVKLLSFHLILMAVFLLAPDLHRLAKVLVLNRTAGPSAQPPLFQTLRANRYALLAQIVFALLLFGTNLYSDIKAWHDYGGGSPKSPLYGIWNIDELAIDGQVRAPLTIDYGRWRRVIFDYPEYMQLQRMDDSITGYEAKIDTQKHTIALTSPRPKGWKGNLTYDRSATDHMTIAGTMGDQQVRMNLSLMDRNQFNLVNRGFHWMQEYPFNR